MSEERFLARWSERKRAARAAPAAPEATSAGRPGVSEDEAAALSDAELLERLALPDPATLGHGADFRRFLRSGVPKRLQRLALRRLWAVAPGDAALDGLVDYADDYTDAAVAAGRIATSYEVGRGLRAHAERLTGEARPVAASEDGAPETVDEDRAEAPERAVEDDVPDAAKPPPKADEPRQPPRRRMAFRFDANE